MVLKISELSAIKSVPGLYAISDSKDYSGNLAIGVTLNLHRIFTNYFLVYPQGYYIHAVLTTRKKKSKKDTMKNLVYMQQVIRTLLIGNAKVDSVDEQPFTLYANVKSLSTIYAMFDILESLPDVKYNYTSNIHRRSNKGKPIFVSPKQYELDGIDSKTYVLLYIDARNKVNENLSVYGNALGVRTRSKSGRKSKSKSKSKVNTLQDLQKIQKESTSRSVSKKRPSRSKSRGKSKPRKYGPSRPRSRSRSKSNKGGLVMPPPAPPGFNPVGALRRN